jgi:hypothetical protein
MSDLNYWLGYFLILLVGSTLLGSLLRYLRRQSRTTLTNVVVVALSLFVTLMVLEFYFKNFFAEPDILDTLARRNWQNWYSDIPREPSNPLLNSWGYRDIEWTPEMVADKVKVMVVGDSFVAGGGLAQVEDRFSIRLGDMVGADYVVFNVGKNGLNTGQVIQAIIEYPYRPDILVFSYYLNDIESVSPPCQGSSNSLLQVSGPLQPLIENSYATNFFYWRLVRVFQSLQPDLRWECLFKAYTDPKIWWLHQQELLSVYEGTRSEQIPLFVVVFPSMLYLEDSKVATEQVINLYQQQNVPVVDVAALVKDLPTKQRIASPMDTHASALVNKLVADKLYTMFVETGLVKDGPKLSSQ